MGRLILLESGSTKTTVLTVELSIGAKKNADLDKTDFQEFIFDGFNPNRPKSELFEEIKELGLTKDDRVYFYGSGLGSQKRKEELQERFKKAFGICPKVYDDLTGAGRALYGDGAGLLAILGTGGIAAYYKSTEILERTGGYGYLIDDFGGGYELGKLTIAAWLNNQLPFELDHALEKQLQIRKAEFIGTYYNDPNWGTSPRGLDCIADVVKLLPAFLYDKAVVDMVELYFDHFFKRNIKPLTKNNECQELKLVGSVAENFKHVLIKIAKQYDLELTQIIRYPALRLLTYHLINDHSGRVSELCKDA